MLYINDDISHFDWQAALPHLSEQRRQQLFQFKHELGRKTCAAAYLLLCNGLRQEYGLTEPPVFEYSEHGKPSIVGMPHIHFNLSHCREAVICALSVRPVGVDVESIRPYKESLARYTMNNQEMLQIVSAPDPARAFTRLWTMKEAVLKLYGTGITDGIKSALADYQVQIETVEHEKYIYSITK